MGESVSSHLDRRSRTYMSYHLPTAIANDSGTGAFHEKYIIVHLPWKIHAAQSASQLRPAKMVTAFRRLGFTVHLVTGERNQRKHAFLEIARHVAAGRKYEFCYSESSTLPTLFASGKKRFWDAPSIDFRFFSWLKRHRIPIGLFLRDIYWRFPEFHRSVRPYSRHIIRLAGYWLDTLVYKLLVDVIFLPSLRMKRYLPRVLMQKRTQALPPGVAESFDVQTDRAYSTPSIVNGEPMRMIYVGGIGQHYRLHSLFEAALLPGFSAFITVCVRLSDWERVCTDYRHYIDSTDKIALVHEGHSALDNLYRRHDIGLIFVEPTTYWEFAMPFKLFEYVGFGLPVVATKGTAAGDFVRDNGLGWSIAYDTHVLSDLTKHLSDNRSEVAQLTKSVRDSAHRHTWSTRACTVSETLSMVDRRASS